MVRGLPNFTLYHHPNASNQAAGIGEYVGMIVLADHAYTIEATVLEYTKTDGKRGRYFSGRVVGGQAVIQSLLRGAKAEGEPPLDLVAMMEATDFDDWLQWKMDPLPAAEEPPAGGSSGAKKAGDSE